jgi:protein required for attachment to host cells
LSDVNAIPAQHGKVPPSAAEARTAHRASRLLKQWMEPVDMDDLRIPNLGWVVVGDGRKALFLRNDGTAAAPRLSVVQTHEAPRNPKTSDQGSERPGRVVSPSDGRRSGVEQTDFHDEAEAAFGRRVAAEVDVLCGDEKTEWVALVAPPRSLAVWRRQLHDRTQPKIKAEIAKDLTKHAVPDLTRVLTGITGAAAPR